MTSIKDAKNMRANINVKGKIVDISKVRTVSTRFGDTKTCDAYLEDESGRIKLGLWDTDCDKVNNNDIIELTGGFTTNFRGEVLLNRNRKDGSIEVCENDDSVIIQTMTEQPTLQDCIDELEKLKPELTIIHAEQVTKIQRMIVSVSEAVLNRSCKT